MLKLYSISCSYTSDLINGLFFTIFLITVDNIKVSDFCRLCLAVEKLHSHGGGHSLGQGLTEGTSGKADGGF